MEDVHIVERFQSLYDLDENAPNIVFFEVGLFLLVLCNFLEEISVVSILHHNTKLNRCAVTDQILIAFKLTIVKRKPHQ